MSRKSHSREVMDLISVLPQSKSPPAPRPTPNRGVDAYKCQPELGARRGPREAVGSSACRSRMKAWRCPRHFAKQTTTKTQETDVSPSGGASCPGSGVAGWPGSAGAGAGQAGITAELRSFGGKHLILPGTIPTCPPACWSHCASLTPLFPGTGTPAPAA